MNTTVECIAIGATILFSITTSLFTYCYCKFMDRLTRLMEENQSLLMRNEVLQDDRRMLQDLLTMAENEKLKLTNECIDLKKVNCKLTMACERRLQNEG